MPTIAVIDQLKKSREMYVSVLPTDTVEMSQMEADTFVRDICLMTDDQLARAIDLTSDATLARAIGQMTDDQRARTMGLLDSEYSQQIVGLMNIEMPVVSDLDKKMLEAVESGCFDMSAWHCGTTHCRAGWAVVFGGKEGEELEKIFGTEFAGKMIYEASTGRMAPDFYSSTEDAIADIRRCAALVS